MSLSVTLVNCNRKDTDSISGAGAPDWCFPFSLGKGVLVNIIIIIRDILHNLYKNMTETGNRGWLPPPLTEKGSGQ